jgi:hypothetical protein
MGRVRKARVGVGQLMILLGLTGMFSPGERPANAAEAVGFYGFGLTVICLGLWFILRGRTRV